MNPVFATLVVSLTAVSPRGETNEWRLEPFGRSAQLTVQGRDKPGFTLLDSGLTGITFTNFLPKSRWLTNSMLLNGSGVAAGDVDRDGRVDLFFANLGGSNALYRNLGGWRFVDVTSRAGIGEPGLSSSGAALADLDGDQDLDLLLTTFGNGVHWFLNDGSGTFRRTAGDAPNQGKAATSSALADIDGDGDLDVYVTNYRFETIRDQPAAQLRMAQRNGKPVVAEIRGQNISTEELAARFSVGPAGQVEENGEVDLLLINHGKGQFVPASFTDGRFLDEQGVPLRSPPRDWGLSARFHDMNQDGQPDLYVCNDFDSPDRIWINQGGGRFRALAAETIRSMPLYSMGVDFADINNDGSDDFIVVDMLSPNDARRHNQIGNLRSLRLPVGEFRNRPQYSRNMLYLGSPGGAYTEISQLAGVQATEWSWCPVFLDVDLDGRQDLIVGTGHEIDAMNVDATERMEQARRAQRLSTMGTLELRSMYPRLALPITAYRNTGAMNFEERAASWGFTNKTVTHGIALADLDNDGDLDLVANNLNDGASLYRNESTAPRILITLRGSQSNTDGVGARIQVRSSSLPPQQLEIASGGRYLSSDQAARVFATAGGTSLVTISWPSGRETILEKLESNRAYEIHEEGATEPERRGEGEKPLFEDVSHLIAHRHVESEYDDFQRQPLLPRELSQGGPGVAWSDINGDGWADLAVGSGRGGSLAVRTNTGRGTFEADSRALLQRKVARDQTAVIVWPGAILAGSSSWEDGATNGGWLRIYDLTSDTSGESVRGERGSVGPMCQADVDGDGTLELFLGARAVPGRYPESGDSLLMSSEGGRLVLRQRFERLGLVSGSLFSDLDNDGFPELILACEWGPVRVFKREAGQFRETTPALGLDVYTGWWNGVATGDFDGDGRLDIAASNWGRNHSFQASLNHPYALRYGDISGAGTVDLLETYHSSQLQKEVTERRLQVIAEAFPFVKDQFTSSATFGEASVQEIFGARLKQTQIVQAGFFETAIFLNRGSRFDIRPLPAPAQFAPAFGINVADFNGDGHEDIFLAQNFFVTHPENPRLDGGRGLILLGNGEGEFQPEDAERSGIKIYGEQRGSAVADYDADGRVDLAVAQNGNETKLFRNRGATPGLRIVVKGSQGNPNSAGVVLRLRAGNRMGPAREIQMGSGYWSQNSPVQVMALDGQLRATELLVRWPGGRETVHPLGDATSIEVSPP